MYPYHCDDNRNRPPHNHNRPGPHHPNINIYPPIQVVQPVIQYPSAPAPAPAPAPPVNYPQYSPPPAAPGYSWIPTDVNQCSNLEGKAVAAGYEGHDRSPIYIGRVWHEGELLPCKVIPRHRAAYFSYDMKEIPIHSFELYCRNDPTVEWIPASNGSVPGGAVVAGRTKSGETLYVGRAHYQGSLTPGKVQQSHGCCYIGFGGAERSIQSYEVLVHIYK